MAIFDFAKTYDGARLTTMMRASVLQNGNLAIPERTADKMGISTERCLLICPYGPKDLAVTTAEKDAEHGFEIRRTGPYFYTPFRSFLGELGIDYVHNRVIFDIIPLNEDYKGAPVYKFNRRIIKHGTKEVEEATPEAEGEVAQ